MRRYIGPVIIGVLGGTVLIALGIWQLQRLDWKEGLLEEIDRRILAAPVMVPDIPDPDRDQYLPVNISGTTGERELHVLVSTRQQGPGFRVVTAIDTAEGRRLLLDRGFIPDEKKTEPRAPAQIEVTGNLHWPDERDRFTPENDPANNFWYAREIDLLAAELATEPVLVVARQETDPAPGITPLPVDTSGIPNDHLGYAVTWFGLAACWLGMTALQLWRISRPRP